MNLNELQVAPGSRKNKTRKARGASTTKGGTSGRGTKGQKAREGKKIRLDFEGGQMPLFRRIPKRGFNNISRKEYEIVSLDKLNQFNENETITPELLVEKGIVNNNRSGIKILGNGTLDKKLSVEANKFSKTAVEAIEKNGGSVKVV